MSNAQKLLDRETRRIIEEVKEAVSGYYTHTILDLDAVCDVNNIQILEGKFEDDNQSGALINENGKWQIVVNEDHPISRKRFTIAHELGHYFAVQGESIQAEIYLEEQNNVIRDYALMKRTDEVDEGTYPVERQANMIAAAILMPDHLVQKLYDQIPRPSVSELASEFGVSEIAMENKLQSMGIDSLEGAV